MGSLASRPSVPQQRVVFIPAPKPEPAPAAAQEGKTDSGNSGDTALKDGENRSAARTASLLKRSRGRFGTIRTGFRGLLSPAGQESGRKTLLGE